MENLSPITYNGRVFNRTEIGEINEIVGSCQGLSRTELANTVCELLSLKRTNGRLKTIECRQFLEYLESRGLIHLPERRRRRPEGSRTRISRTERGDIHVPLSGQVSQYSPISLSRVHTKDERDLWYEYIDRYHYLGYRLPFGAQLRYFVETGEREKTILGCLQFSSPAWKMHHRDRWIGWNEEQRRRNLQKIINNSRFLIFPWVQIKYLASSILGLVARRIVEDWESQYGYRPVLLETLVDCRRYKGTCYKAANWVHVGTTAGRGRMDRENRRYGLAPKAIYLYPLTRGFREELLAL